MDEQLRVLLIEDSEDDAALVVRALRRGGHEPSLLRVDTAEALREALECHEWDLIISDYSMPSFNGMAALELVRARGLDAPFILVSGAVGEETATAIMRAGARDYVMKDKLGRLAPVVARELEEAANRRSQRQTDKAITALVHGVVGTTGEECFGRIVEGLCELLAADSGIIAVQEEGGRMRTLSCRLGGEKKNNFTFPLVSASPCGVVVAKGYQLYPQGVATLFPDYKPLHDRGVEGYAGISLRNARQQVIGTLCILSSQPLRPPARLREIMEIVAAKAVSEIERQRTEAERGQLEAQLRQSQKMEAIGTLAGGIAHDFNNILAAILGYAELAKEEVVGKADCQDAVAYLGEVLNASFRAKGLVQQILAFSRKEELQRTQVNVRLIVEEALKLLRATLPTTVAIQQEVAPDCWPVVANHTQLHQVLLNLCTNASHAMEDAGGVLTVTLHNTHLDAAAAAHHDLPAGDYLRMEVRDTGKGMPQSVKERIFEPYFTTKEQGKGVGMGLSVVHGIVKGHGGGIGVESVEGQGTTFMVFLPRGAVGEEEKRESLAGQGASSRGQERLMVVDDESAIVHFEKVALEQMGYRVSIFTDPEAALRVFTCEPHTFDLVITDQTMPKLPGTELVKKMLAVRPDIPIILCTGFSSQVSEELAGQIGVRRYLMKPVALKEMTAAIREILDQK